MLSILTGRAGPSRFRLRWLGYDRAEVDEFVREAAAERHKLQQDLAQVELALASHGAERRRELERMAALRAEVASCLEASIGALRTATERLAAHTRVEAAQPSRSKARGGGKPAAQVTGAPSVAARVLNLAASWSGWPSIASIPARRVVVAVLATVALAALTFSLWGNVPQAGRSVSTGARDSASQPASPAMHAPDAPQGVVLTLTAMRECWVSMRVDGGDPFERLLKADETIILRANQEAVLRAGDAAALMMLINSEPAKPLGGRGEVVTARITPENYLSFLAGG